jgi:hypothetical protein
MLIARHSCVEHKGYSTTPFVEHRSARGAIGINARLGEQFDHFGPIEHDGDH